MQRIAAVLFAALIAAGAQAGPFGLFGRRGTQPQAQTQQATQQPVQIQADWRASAQGVANHMASIGHIGHFGGNRGYEGVGMGATPQAAEWNCCYRRRWTPIEVGIAQGRNGWWYACCRY